MKKELIILLLGFIFQPGFSQKIIDKNLQTHFAKYNVEGCFVLFNQSDNEYIRYNALRCDTGYIPASTFKIPNSVISLEEKVIQDANQVIKWNGKEHSRKELNQDQTLSSAMKYSCVWVYIGFAEQIGIENYQAYMDSFNYGNKKLTGPPTYFWLAGDFKISANQQVEFLRKFYNYELGVSRKSVDIVKNIIVLEQTDTYKLCGKTGGGIISDKEDIMWLVGYVEKGNKPYFYAMNFTTSDYAKTMHVRYDLVKDILKELKLIK